MHSIFAATEGTQAWLDAIGTVPDNEARSVRIPDADTWRSWLEYVEVPNEDIEAVIATTPSSDSDLYGVLQRGAAYLLRYTDSFERPVPFAPLADFNDPQTRYFYVQLLAACLPSARTTLAARGIPEEIIQATLADLGRNVRVHRKREGVGGLGVQWWLMLHFRGMIFQLGRLQFERQLASEEVVASMQQHGIEASSETHVLSVHIPDFMGPMDQQACDDAIRKATEFFPRYFPDWPVEYAVCNSWLLDPQLKAILKPESNIIKFQDRYELADGQYDASESVMQFVFGKHMRDIDTITPSSSLERGVIQKLRDGGSWYGREGWFALPQASADI
ncbi:MAG: acyltransferase domain-containing protein [Thermomicrobiales bacterium]|nr:acyltransferase domain-containing protein [Thermomicrobiales bacterium]